MSALTPAEELEALRNKCALLGASLRQAEAEVEALKAERTAAPLLSDVLAPAFTDAQEEEINDALNWRRQLTGDDLPWIDPGHDVTIPRQAFAQLAGAVHGVLAVSRMVQILLRIDNDSTKADPALLEGLDCALVALAETVDDRLEGLVV
jgi:hypothetical protein